MEMSTAVLQTPIRVMMIEDDRAVAMALQRALQRAGMMVEWVPTGAAAHARKSGFNPNVTLVDLNLPDVNGIDLVAWLSAQQDCGVIVVSGSLGEADRVLGLERGADDYICKPPSSRELVARIRAVHRRVRDRMECKRDATVPSVIDAGSFTVDFAHRTAAQADGQPIRLSLTEFKAIELLANARSEPVTREELSERVLGRKWQPNDRGVDQLIYTLRTKLPPDAYGRSPIHSIRGLGYTLPTVGPA